MGDRPYRPATKVLYIGGTGRTGSTLLTRLLGEVPGWFPGGELAFLWRFGLVRGGLCSCGRPIVECSVWSRVLELARAGGAEIDGERMLELRRRCWSIHLPLMAHPAMAATLMDRLEEYPSIVETVYDAVAEVTESSVIVDSSKEPHYSWILRDRTGLDVYFLQLVRDPRAVAHSWRRVRRERGLEADAHMERRGPVRSAVYYNVSNVAAEAIWSRNPERFRFLRYEEFVADPAGALAAIGEFVGESVDPDLLDGTTFRAHEQHMAWGNPGRFGEGEVTISADEEWKESLGVMRSAISTAATYPLASRYGYPLRSDQARRSVRASWLRRSQILAGGDHG